MSKILITGCCGFIGFHLTLSLLKAGYTIVGVDNINAYYDIGLKHRRLELLQGFGNDGAQLFKFYKLDISSLPSVSSLFQDECPEIVVNLAAQAGVRYSLENPSAYINSNIIGFFNVLECCKLFSVRHLLYASSSSVYGANTKQPFSEEDMVDSPLNIYAASKKSNELLAYSYANLYQLRTTGLRFFTVYGPWGRPDMALYLFADAIFQNRPIKVFNDGNMVRDFTYIDDIVNSIAKLIQSSSPLSEGVPSDIFNVGNSSPHTLMEYIGELERALGKSAQKIFMPLQPGDVPKTVSDCSKLLDFIGYKPSTPISTGIDKFVDWYRSYNNLENS